MKIRSSFESKINNKTSQTFKGLSATTKYVPNCFAKAAQVAEKYISTPEQKLILTLSSLLFLPLIDLKFANEDKKIENSVISIENDKLKEAYLKIFKTLDNYKEVNFKDNCIQFVYNSSSNIYMAIDTTCSVNNDTLIRNIDDIYIKDDELVIELSVGILNNDKLSNIDGTIIGDYNNIEQLKDKLNKYTFVFEKSNDNYYIKEIKRK